MSPASALFGSMAVATAAMLFLTGSRWHSDAAQQPDRFPAGDGIRVLVVHQHRDCPGDLEFAEGLLSAVRETGIPAESLRLSRIDPDLRGLLRGRIPAGERPIHRAIVRSGTGSTPVALVLDREGVIRFVHPLAGGDPHRPPDRTLAALDAVVRILALDGPAPLEGSVPRDESGRTEGFPRQEGVARVGRTLPSGPEEV